MSDFAKLIVREVGRERRRRSQPKPFDYLDQTTWPEDDEAFTAALWGWMLADPPQPDAMADSHDR